MSHLVLALLVTAFTLAGVFAFLWSERELRELRARRRYLARRRRRPGYVIPPHDEDWTPPCGHLG